MPGVTAPGYIWCEYIADRVVCGNQDVPPSLGQMLTALKRQERFPETSCSPELCPSCLKTRRQFDRDRSTNVEEL